MLKRIYTKTLPPTVHPEGAYLPLNPFTFLQQQLHVIASALMDSISPEVDVLGRFFSSSFEGIIIDKCCSDIVDVSVSVEASSADEQNMQRSCSVADHISSLLSNEPAHVDTVLLRRSARSNKYDGFKTHSVSDSRARASRVKPRCIPSAAAPSSHGVPDSSKNDMIPPPTPVPVLQQIGISKCAIPPEEITAEVLLAEPEEGPSNA